MTTDTTAAADSEWAACHCCGLSFPAARMVAFVKHPDDRLCTGCAEWLYCRSRQITRKLHQLWQLSALFKLRRTRTS
jgi:hypothetical protein